MQREQVLDHALNVLEQHGLSATSSLEELAGETEFTPAQLQQLWSDRDALLYDALRYHALQIDGWRDRLLQDNSLNTEEKLLARYRVLEESVSNGRFPGCLFISACSLFPQPEHPLHQLAERQKRASWQYTYQLLTQLETDNPTLVADQMELILEGCLSKLLIKRNRQDITVARLLAEDVLRIAMCRRNGALA